ncbi:DNA-directed RNA polymerase subunit alpha C-terminal domain-containing protein [Candidatus Carsonella ruddii]|uniref:DNA-directed RNA polymerase subunit alpha n=1 Tax=Candidatus Carsonella ruddii CE isolate Thao2000 TaxID=1202536 RepID=J7GYF6_CARRU|nr:DNA-directed RNA polymerase subunit alpha C-terminal domain-containing protein [Candidatus Carsonella ruddii]AFP83618.1 RNA polymerase alpha subunit [Candidatus Carsonella ruddii CE isolate Thao2000]
MIFNKKIFFINKINIKKINKFRSIIRIEPFFNSYCDTIGNFLRRTMFLTSFCYYISHIKIYNSKCFFSGIKGVNEDISSIIKNIKNIIFRIHNSSFAYLIIKKKGPCIVKAKDIFSDKKISIINPDKIIANINCEVIFFVLMKCIHSSYKNIIDKNFKNKLFKSKVFILKNLNISLLNINYYIHKKNTNKKIKKLFLDIETNGSISVECCFKNCIFYIKKYFDLLFTILSFKINNNNIINNNNNIINNNNNIINPLFLRSIDNLELSIRSSNCLKSNNIFCIGELIVKNEIELIKIPKFGLKSLNEVKKLLFQKGLSLNMTINYEL